MSTYAYSIAEEIVARFGTPVYVVEESLLRESLEELSGGIKQTMPNIQLAYPYKANNVKEIIQFFHTNGLWAEVTSAIELTMAARLNVPFNNILFNGPWKTTDELEYAFKNNILVFCDNEPELVRLESIVTSGRNLLFPMGIRVNTSTVTSAWNKFGLNIEDGTAFSVAQKIADSGKLKLVGVHAHFQSNIQDIGLYRKLLTVLRSFIDDLMEVGLLDLQFLDIGSGFAVLEPKPLDKPNWEIPNISDYAKIISDCLHGLPSHTKIIIEPGRFLVSSAVSLMTRVVAAKSGSTLKTVVVDAGLSMIPNREHYHYRVTSFGTDSWREKCRIFGALCSNYDVLADEVEIPYPKVGDILTIHDIGAYNLGRSVTWNLPLPPIVMVNENGQIELLRERQTLTDIWKS